MKMARSEEHDGDGLVETPKPMEIERNQL